MTGCNVPAGAFRNPTAAQTVSRWLETQASPQERAQCLRFLSILNGLAGSRVPAAPIKHSYPGSLPADAPAATARACDSGMAAVGRAKDLCARPSTASGVTGGGRTPTHFQQIPAQPQTPRQRPASAMQLSRDGGGAAPAEHAPGSDWVTTNDQFYGFRTMYPTLYAAAAAATKAVPAANMTFKSEYSESLKKGSGEYWKQFLATTYETTNKSVHKTNLDYQVRKEAGFCGWMKKQQLYYGDLLTPEAAEALDAVLENTDATTKTDILGGSRCLFALLRPDANKPVSHLLHCPQKPITEPYFEEMQKAVTKMKTMGPPVDVKPRCIPHRVRPQSCGGVPRTAAMKSTAPGGAVRLDPDTFSSKIPMKWPVGGGPIASNYQETIGASGTRAVHAIKGRLAGYKPVCITCPIGAVDPVTDISRFTRFPVPEAFLQDSGILWTDPDRNPPETTNRMVFQKRSATDVAASMRFAAQQVAESQKMKNKSTIPLGKGGFNIAHDGFTEKSRNYHAWPINAAENNAASTRAKLAMNGPTSSVGVTLGGRMA